MSQPLSRSKLPQPVDPRELLNKSRVETSPEIFALVSITHDEWRSLLGSPELSPSMTAPFMILMDPREVTLMLDEQDLARIQPALRNGRIENGFRMLTFDVELDFDVSGFLAEISRILAEAEIPIIALSAYSRDHILIKQDQLAAALRVLGPYVADLC